MISWKVEREDLLYVYESDDLCACVWVESFADAGGKEHVCIVQWDVSGPEGKGTKASGTVPQYKLSHKARVQIARSLAEHFIYGYRQAARELWPQYKKGETL